MVKSCVHKLINREKLRQHVDQRVDQYQPNMLVSFGMGENVGQKMICQRRSISHKNIFAQNVGKVVRLTKHADIAFLYQNVVQLSNIMTMSKNRHVELYKQVAPRSLPVILANMLAKFTPCLTHKNVFAADENIDLLVNKF